MPKKKATEEKTTGAKKVKTLKEPAPKLAVKAAPKASTGKAIAQAAAPPKRIVRFNSPIDDEAREIFLRTLPKYAAAKKRISDATNALRTMLKAAKADGYAKHDFEVAEKIQKAEGERELQVAIHRDLEIARWLGAAIGHKADLFAEDMHVQVQESAYDEGKKASMQGHTAKPGDHGYDPGTEGYTAYMQGFHDDQKRRMKQGIKPLHPDVQAERNAQVELDEAEAARQFDIEEAFERGEPVVQADEPPASGTPMTRAQLNKMREEGTGIFQRKAAN